jgi:hypothetical protein
MQRHIPRWLSGLALTLIATSSCNDPYRPQADPPAPQKSQPNALGDQVFARLPLAARLTAELDAGRCGEPLRLRGKMTLAGLSGRFIFRWSDPAARQKIERVVDVAVLSPGQGFTFETTAPARAAAEAPDLYVQFLDTSGRLLSRPLPAGRCGAVQTPLAASTQIDARAALDVALYGCSRDVAQAAASGQLTLPGLLARVLFVDATSGKRALAAEVVVPLLAAGTCLELPKQAVPVPDGAEVFFSFVDADGRPLSIEFPLGHCGDLPL